ncbi:hydrolase [Pseudomonas viridiflava]|uniref:hydrolase n=1 Tax=Pseudomonas viridiflava TaxID=33069 RepID=UPI000F035840|nr:hydrolase [Pseudomonas viridiflava]
MRMRKSLAAKIGGFLLASLIAGTSLPAFAANDCDLDNDHITDATCGGNDKDLDNDHSTDAAFGGNDTDQDNDHSTDKYNVGAPPHAKK